VVGLDLPVRSILANPLFTGRIQWNTSQFVRDPDTGKHKRRVRPRSEWFEHHDESLRIVSDATFKAARDRTRVRADGDERLKSGGKAKFLLSGLLKCTCGSNYVMVNQRSYGCAGYREGACHNSICVRRDHAEDVLLRPIRDELLAPERVARMAWEIRDQLGKRVRESLAKAKERPREIQELEDRVARLRERQRKGDPDMTSEEIQTVINRLLHDRERLEVAQPGEQLGENVVTVLPNAAELYRRQITQGLDGDPRAALKARLALRKLCGTIVLEPGEGGSLWARYELQPAALLTASVGTVGRGEGICSIPTLPQRVRLK
jgi:hypothetical protein